MYKVKKFISSRKVWKLVSQQPTDGNALIYIESRGKITSEKRGIYAVDVNGKSQTYKIEA
jgi:hypothetical protein